jgi:hypothetical protein
MSEGAHKEVLTMATIEIKIADYDPVRLILSAAAELVAAVADHLELVGVDPRDPDAPESERGLCDALMVFKATVEGS